MRRSKFTNRESARNPSNRGSTLIKTIPQVRSSRPFASHCKACSLSSQSEIDHSEAGSRDIVELRQLAQISERLKRLLAIARQGIGMPQTTGPGSSPDSEPALTSTVGRDAAGTGRTASVRRLIGRGNVRAPITQDRSGTQARMPVVRHLLGSSGRLQ
jgi:hypothetical protein